MIDLAWEFVLWLVGGIARALGRADTESRERERGLGEWGRIERRR